MKAAKQSTIPKRIRQAAEEQVLEYARRYHPEMGKVVVEISPCGTFARVRDKSKSRTPGDI